MDEIDDTRRAYEPLPTEEAIEGFGGVAFAFAFALLLLVVVAGMWLAW